MKRFSSRPGFPSRCLEELYNYAKPNVERIARKYYNNEQTPELRIPMGMSFLLKK